jgi:5-methylcytosine-specific restriction endonuclease McrA
VDERTCSVADCDRKVSAKGFCKPHYGQDYYQRTREKQRAQRRDWYEANSEQIKANLRAAYQADPVTYQARVKAWNARNPDYQRLYFAKRYAEHRAELLAAKKVYYQKHREELMARAREWALANPEARRVIRRRWKKTERGRLTDLANAHVRIARKRGAPGRATPEQLTARWNYYGGRCWMCFATAEQFDHVIPLSRGGANWPANLRPACAICNQKKAARRSVATSNPG